MKDSKALSRREREVMDIIHQRGRATAAEVRAAMSEPPTDAAVRSTLRILVRKGHLSYDHSGPRYVYSATEAPDAARGSALMHLLETFFDGSTEGAMAALLELRGGKLEAAERRRLKRLIDRAEREGR